MRVMYLTINPNRESTTVPTEGWFRVLGPKGLEPVVVSIEPWLPARSTREFMRRFRTIRLESHVVARFAG